MHAQNGFTHAPSFQPSFPPDARNVHLCIPAASVCLCLLWVLAGWRGAPTHWRQEVPWAIRFQIPTSIGQWASTLLPLAPPPFDPNRNHDPPCGLASLHSPPQQACLSHSHRQTGRAQPPAQRQGIANATSSYRYD
eukprot:GGOE01047491.1.p3 GENE.GGOE01047491.1~~GGOE01047491.1.p3  ORF type:complete len:136 (+),score=8.58 GGOE01047491.1:300-707(+)